MKRIGAVLAGLLFIVVVSTATDAVLHATGVFPPFGQPMSDALFMLATSYRIVFAIAGCYLAARLAPDRPMQHALILGLIGVVVSTAGMVATMGKGPEFGPSDRAHRHRHALRVDRGAASRHAGTRGDVSAVAHQ